MNNALVITVVYNREKTIQRCLDSIAKQTYRNVTHVIIDGASNDGTLGIIRQCKSPNLILISEKDDGIYDALNKAYNLVQQKFDHNDVIFLLNSDDEFEDDDVISNVMARMQDREIDVLFGNLRYVDNSAKTIRNWRAGNYRRYKLFLGWIPPHPAVYFRTGLLAKLKIKYNAYYKISGDYDFLLRLFSSRVNYSYYDFCAYKMYFGGVSNAGFHNQLKKSQEDIDIISKNIISHPFSIFVLISKMTKKLVQFL